MDTQRVEIANFSLYTEPATCNSDVWLQVVKNNIYNNIVIWTKSPNLILKNHLDKLETLKQDTNLFSFITINCYNNIIEPNTEDYKVTLLCLEEYMKYFKAVRWRFAPFIAEYYNRESIIEVAKVMGSLEIECLIDLPIDSSYILKNKSNYKVFIDAITNIENYTEVIGCKRTTGLVKRADCFNWINKYSKKQLSENSLDHNNDLKCYKYEVDFGKDLHCTFGCKYCYNYNK